MVPHAIAKYNIGKHHALMRKIKKSEETKYGEFIKYGKDDVCIEGRIHEYYKNNNEALRCYIKSSQDKKCVMGMYFAARLYRHDGKLRQAASLYERITWFCIRTDFTSIVKKTFDKEDFVICHLNKPTAARCRWIGNKSVFLKKEFEKQPMLKKYIAYSICQRYSEEKCDQIIPNLDVSCDDTRKKLILKYQQLILGDLYIVLRMLVVEFLV